MNNIISQSAISPIQDVLKFLPPQDVSFFKTSTRINAVTKDAILHVLAEENHFREFRIRVREELLQDAINEKPTILTYTKYKNLLLLIDNLLNNKLVDEFVDIKLALYVLREGVKLRLHDENWSSSINYLKKVMHHHDEADALIALLPLLLEQPETIFEYANNYLARNRYNYHFLHKIVKSLEKYPIRENEILNYYDNLRIYKLSNINAIKLTVNEESPQNNKKQNKENKHKHKVNNLSQIDLIFSDIKNNIYALKKIIQFTPHVLTKNHLEALIKYSANSGDAQSFKNIFTIIQKRQDLFCPLVQQRLIALLNLNNHKIKDNTLELLNDLAKNNLLKVDFVNKIEHILTGPTDSNYSKSKALYLLGKFLDENVNEIDTYMAKIFALSFNEDIGIKKAATDVLLHLCIKYEDYITEQKYPLIFTTLQRNIEEVKLKSKALYPKSPFFNEYQETISVKNDLHTTYQLRFFNADKAKVVEEIKNNDAKRIDAQHQIF